MSRTTAFLLLALAALNMPQALVLCVGHDGHVSIEPAAHDHCVERSRLCGAGPLRLETGEHSHVDHEHCWPCVDIPIPVATGDGRTSSPKSRATPLHVVAFAAPALHTFDSSGLLREASSWWLPSGSTLLRCTILQV